MSIVKYIHAAGFGDVATTGKMNTATAAKRLGVSKVTLLRWFREGKIADVGRDRNKWRVFTSADIARIRKQMGLDE
jgi:excisionase family DNA binding protein